MATNGMAPSFFPANFLLQMQQPLPQHHHEAHEHETAAHHHLLAPPPPALVSPFLHDFGGAMAALGGGGGMGGGDDSHVHAVEPHQQQDDAGGGGAASDDDEEGSGAPACGGGERKRRLSVEQVRTLERSFEVANKLEPERKAQLARALGLQPRQVAIWFQNRRARWKTKQLEKDYDALRRQLDAARAENDALLSHNKKLQAEIMALKGGGGGGGGRQEAASELINLNVKETEASCSNRSENSSEINLDISRPPQALSTPAAAADESPTMNSYRGGGLQFYAAARAGAGAGIDHLLQHSGATAAAPKMELGHGAPDETPAAAAAGATFGSLLCGAAVDEQQSFWPWSDGHHTFQ